MKNKKILIFIFLSISLIWFTYALSSSQTLQDSKNINFIDNWDWTVSDSVTWLIWQKDNTGAMDICKTYDTNDFVDDQFFPWYLASECNDWNIWDDCNQCAARLYCENLDLWWKTNWKLPNIKELYSILDVNKWDQNLDWIFTYYYDDIFDLDISSLTNKFRNTVYDKSIDYGYLISFSYWKISYDLVRGNYNLVCVSY